MLQKKYYDNLLFYLSVVLLVHLSFKIGLGGGGVWMGFSWELGVPQNAVYMFTSCSVQVHNGYLLCSQFVPQESDELTDKGI
jgi:hypothetical protein